jgi:hypothetical protein
VGCSPSSRGGRALLRALAVGLGCAWLVAATWSAAQGEAPYEWQLAEPAPVAELRTQVNPAWREVSCAQCHEEIAREWGASLHAQAWNDEVYQDELRSVRRKKSCHGCHAPQPLLGTDLAARPQVREMWQHHGVDCRACHLGPDGAIHGPHGAPSSGHTSVKDEAFTDEGSNAMCISCHRVSIGPVIGIAKDFEEGALASTGLTCVGCHMAPVERSMAIDDYTGAPLPPRAGRSHALQTPRDPAFLAQAFRLEVERTERGALLRVHNRAGHRVPGLEDRRIVFTVELLDASSEVLATAELVVSRREYIPFGEFSELGLEGSGGERLRVRATHDSASLESPVTILERELELAP